MFNGAVFNNFLFMTTTASRDISLAEVGRKYMSALQRLSDLMAYMWTCAHTASPQIYDQAPTALPGLPKTEFRMDFAAVREEAERWWLHHSVNELLGLTSLFLDDVRKLCSLIAFNAARLNASGDLTALAAEVNTPPSKADIASRLQHVKTRYQIVSPFEAEILSFAGFGQVLYRGGVVPKETVVKLQLKCVQPAGQAGPQARLVEMQRSWGPEEKLLLTREQHSAVFTTMSLFLGSMLAAVQEFAHQSGLPDTPPGS